MGPIQKDAANPNRYTSMPGYPIAMIEDMALKPGQQEVMTLWPDVAITDNSGFTFRTSSAAMATKWVAEFAQSISGATSYNPYSLYGHEQQAGVWKTTGMLAKGFQLVAETLYNLQTKGWTMDMVKQNQLTPFISKTKIRNFLQTLKRGANNTVLRDYFGIFSDTWKNGLIPHCTMNRIYGMGANDGAAGAWNNGSPITNANGWPSLSVLQYASSQFGYLKLPHIFGNKRFLIVDDLVGDALIRDKGINDERKNAQQGRGMSDSFVGGMYNWRRIEILDWIILIAPVEYRDCFNVERLYGDGLTGTATTVTSGSIVAGTPTDTDMYGLSGADYSDFSVGYVLSKEAMIMLTAPEEDMKSELTEYGLREGAGKMFAAGMVRTEFVPEEYTVSTQTEANIMSSTYRKNVGSGEIIFIRPKSYAETEFSAN
jgi:hypothetical protein